MAGFFKLMLRMNSNMIGVVTGTDFRNGNLPMAYLGEGEKEGKGKLMIYGEKLDDYVFDRENVVSCTIVQQETHFRMANNQYIGPKYQVKFKDGKVAMICIPAKQAFRLENVIM